MDWGREYEDEDTWYEMSTSYQTGPDTHLLPSKDTSLTVRMAKYRRTTKEVTFRAGSVRSSMKERQDLRELEKELEKEDVLTMFSTTRSLWQRRNIMASSATSEGQ